jgi:hypothetical protein
MSEMLPSYISPDVRSNAEKKVFQWFKESPGTENWIVLHSLGISRHIRLIYGEIDFLVLAPQLGIFVLEVKGGRVRRQNGIWYFTDKYGNTASKPRGPFEQASEGMFSIIEALKRKYGSESSITKCLYGYGVMFPDFVFEDDTIEINKWQIFDKNDNNNVKGFIKRLAYNCSKQLTDKFGIVSSDTFPDNKIIKQIISFLRGDFDRPVAFQDEINETETMQKKLTTEQFICLDSVEDNPRCLVQGPAGTGKTILAIEDAVRSLSRNENVALICYNSLLGEYLKQYFQTNDKYGKPYYAGTFHSFMLHIVRNAGIETGKYDFEQEDFWETELPLLVLEALNTHPVNLDKIIIDEAQDLIMDNYLDVFDTLVLKGISRGKWSFFGDFSRQSIYNDISPDSMMEMLENRASFVNYKLLINCRNTLPICNEIQYITGFSGSKYIKNAASGLPVNYLTWKDNDEQVIKLDNLLTNLTGREHIMPGLITILSPHKMNDSIVARVHTKIKAYAKDSMGITFCTIQAFKGLENSVIIMVDINSYDNDKLLYTGLSRARAALYVFESEHAHSERTKKLLKAVEK